MPGPTTRPGDTGPTPTSNPQVYFANEVAKRTGLDPRVVYAWTVIEGANAPGGTGGYDFLNLRPYPGDPYSGRSAGGFELFSNVNDAITATVRRLNQPFAAGILASAEPDKQHGYTPTPSGQISAIAASGWDAGHYTKNGVQGQALLDTFAHKYGTDGLTGPAQSTGLGTAGTGASLSDLISNPLTGWVSNLTGWLTKEAKLVLAYVLLGGAAVALFVMGAKGLGAPIPTARQLAGAAA